MNDVRIANASVTQLQNAHDVLEQVYKWSSLIAGLASVAMLAIGAVSGKPVEDATKAA